VGKAFAKPGNKSHSKETGAARRLETEKSHRRKWSIAKMLILSVDTHATLPLREQRNYVCHRKLSTRLPGRQVENCLIVCCRTLNQNSNYRRNVPYSFADCNRSRKIFWRITRGLRCATPPALCSFATTIAALLENRLTLNFGTAIIPLCIWFRPIPSPNKNQ